MKLYKLLSIGHPVFQLAVILKTVSDFPSVIIPRAKS